MMLWPQPEFKKLPSDLVTYCPHGYSMDCYCDHLNPAHKFEEFPHSFIGRSRTEVFKQARKAGWRIHNDNSATCPKCVAALRQSRQENKS